MLGPKEPNLYKDLSQGTVTKGIQIKIFFPKKIFFENFFLKIWIWIQMVIQMRNPDPDSAESRSRLRIWITIWIQIQIFKKKFSKKIFFF